MQQIPPKNGWPSAKLYSVTDGKTIILVLTKILKKIHPSQLRGFINNILGDITCFSPKGTSSGNSYIYIYIYTHTHTYIHTYTHKITK